MWLGTAPPGLWHPGVTVQAGPGLCSGVSLLPPQGHWDAAWTDQGLCPHPPALDCSAAAGASLLGLGLGTRSQGTHCQSPWVSFSLGFNLRRSLPALPLSLPDSCPHPLHYQSHWDCWRRQKVSDPPRPPAPCHSCVCSFTVPLTEVPHCCS